MCLDNDPEELQRLATAIEEFAEREDWPAPVVYRVNLVLEEMVMNVIVHGSCEGLAEIKVTVTSDSDLISVELTDNGIAFNPLTDAPEAEVTGSVEDRHVGGLGIHLMRTMMDDISYKREMGKNILAMTTKKE